MLSLEDDTLLDDLFDAPASARVEQHLFTEPISHLGLDEPVCVRPTDSVRHAIAAMVEARVGAVPVVTQEGAVVGIFTERDVLRRVTLQQLDLDATSVQAVMTPDPVCVAPHTAHAEALGIMIGQGFRHLCVVEEGRITGIFSMRELVRFVRDLFPQELSVDPVSAAS